MGLWITMFLCNLLIPALMLGVGIWYSGHTPGRINAFVGYRTPRSMKNEETWRFAHRIFGRLWRRMGAILLPVSAVLMLLLLGRSEETVLLGSLILCMAELAGIVASIFPVEQALKKNFTADGRPILPPGGEEETK